VLDQIVREGGKIKDSKRDDSNPHEVNLDINKYLKQKESCFK